MAGWRIQLDRQATAAMATQEELRGVTVERLRELCVERGIPVHRRRKEELVAALAEREKDPEGGLPAGGDGGATLTADLLGPAGGDGGAAPTADLFGLVLEMQRQQMSWMEVQQKRQEVWMSVQQETQREMFERLWAQERERAATEGARRTTKPPRPMLQKLSEKDDVESPRGKTDDNERSRRGRRWLRVSPSGWGEQTTEAATATRGANR